VNGEELAHAACREHVATITANASGEVAAGKMAQRRRSGSRGAAARSRVSGSHFARRRQSRGDVRLLPRFADREADAHATIAVGCAV